ncbi:MAG: hypothetical protein QGH38_02155 [Candidatus Thalassarchaeaceae archaeon]|nr:hypothetical protein [Candidatus Thalassarchaeaceae archaeon]
MDSGALHGAPALEVQSWASAFLRYPNSPLEARGLGITNPMVIGCEFRVAKPGGGFFDNGST